MDETSKVAIFVAECRYTHLPMQSIVDMFLPDAYAFFNQLEFNPTHAKGIHVIEANTKRYYIKYIGKGLTNDDVLNIIKKPYYAEAGHQTVLTVVDGKPTNLHFLRRRLITL